MGRRYDSYGSVGEFYALLGQWFEEVKLFPTCKGGVDFLAGDCGKDLREVVRSYGWPPANADGGGWRRKECLEEVERTLMND